MSEIKITYYGHSCFKLEYQNDSIVFDPYQTGSVPGIALPEDLSAGTVSCSHEHGDHNAREMVHIVPCEDRMSMYTITADHDDCGGEKRGKSDIAIVEAGNVRIAHMGDLGRDLSDEEYEELKDLDVVMIPVGGYYTIDAALAKQIVTSLQPKLVILMHYRRGDAGYDVIESLDNIQKVFTETQVLDTNTIVFDEESVPSGVIALTPER